MGSPITVYTIGFQEREKPAKNFKFDRFAELPVLSNRVSR
jgi:hypothetical protein